MASKVIDLRPDVIAEMSEKIDPGRLLEAAFNTHYQLDEIIRLSKDWIIPEVSPENVVISGMGGSAIGGDLIKALCSDKVRVPVMTCRDYKIPAFVGENTLAIVCSYSGNTEESLSAYSRFVEKKAKVFTISTGGALEERSRRDGSLHFRIPGGLQPRAALGYLFSSLFMLLSKSGILPLSEEYLRDASEFLKKVEGNWMSWKKIEENQPLEIALKMRGKIPVIHGTAGILEPVSYRWRTQFNENSKMFASNSVYPELDHNEIVGLSSRSEVLGQVHVITLIDESESDRIKKRIDLTRKRIRDSVSATDVVAKGSNQLQKMLYCILFGDLVSIYSAYLQGKNPSEIDSINWLKIELSR